MAQRLEGEQELGGYAAKCRHCDWYFSNTDEKLPKSERLRAVVVETTRHNRDIHPNIKPNISMTNL